MSSKTKIESIAITIDEAYPIVMSYTARNVTRELNVDVDCSDAANDPINDLMEFMNQTQICKYARAIIHNKAQWDNSRDNPTLKMIVKAKSELLEIAGGV
jgi:hypothetical protein